MGKAASTISVLLIICGSFVIGSYFGHTMAVRMMRIQAVTAEVGEWVISNPRTGKSKFEWKSPDNPTEIAVKEWVDSLAELPTNTIDDTPPADWHGPPGAYKR